MTNVKLTRNGNKLTIEVDLSEDHGPSSSGKTKIIGTTHGAKAIDLGDGKDAFVNLNVYRKA